MIGQFLKVADEIVDALRQDITLQSSDLRQFKALLHQPKNEVDERVHSRSSRPSTPKLNSCANNCSQPFRGNNTVPFLIYGATDMRRPLCQHG